METKYSASFTFECQDNLKVKLVDQANDSYQVNASPAI